MDQFSFVVSDIFEEIEFSENERLSLNEPSCLSQVRLLTDWWGDKYEIIDFTGFTKRDAIIRILAFYEDENILTGIGDHIFYEGFHIIDGVSTIFLGS